MKRALSALVLAALTVGASAALAQERRYAAADADRNGVLSRTEVARSLPRLAPRFEELDRNRDGNISPEELRARGRPARGGTSEGGFAEHFRRADADGDGALTRAEAETTLPRLAAKFDRIDADRDAQLTQDELRRYFDARRAARGKAGESIR
jgi:Ca2+-binding EF-hand superfamily protein